MPFIVNPSRFAVAGGGGGGPPSPYAAAANLVMWYRADQGTYSDLGITHVTANGSSVEQWNDLSGNNNHAVRYGSSASAPTLVTGAINGLPAINFASQYYALPNVIGSLTSGEVFIVLKVDNDPSTSGNGGLWHLGSTFTFNTHCPYSDGHWYESFGTTARRDLGDPTPSLSSTYRVLNLFSASNDYAAFIDGSSQFSTGTNTVAFPAGESGFVPSLGCSVSATSYQLYGRIAEFLFYNVKLGGTDRATVTAALGTRYGLF